MKQYVIIRQGVMDQLIATGVGNVQKTSLKKLTVTSPIPLIFFENKPDCPFACGVFKVENDFDTLYCVESNWDTTD